jgi:hypothetical protein
VHQRQTVEIVIIIGERRQPVVGPTRAVRMHRADAARGAFPLASAIYAIDITSP